jgi:hypothetical protein
MSDMSAGGNACAILCRLSETNLKLCFVFGGAGVFACANSLVSAASGRPGGRPRNRGSAPQLAFEEYSILLQDVAIDKLADLVFLVGRFGWSRLRGLPGIRRIWIRLGIVRHG